MKYILIPLLVLNLSGCFHTSGVVSKAIPIDSARLQPCDILPQAEVVSAEDVSIENLNLYEYYAVCARKQEDSIKLIKKLANIKD